MRVDDKDNINHYCDYGGDDTDLQTNVPFVLTPYFSVTEGQGISVATLQLGVLIPKRQFVKWPSDINNRQQTCKQACMFAILQNPREQSTNAFKS